MGQIQKGTAAFNRVNVALFIAGFVTFTVLYNTQPLLPVFSREFQLSPTVASLAISVTTAILAFSLMFAAAISNIWGRKSIMVVSLLASSAIALLSAWSPDFPILLITRLLQGLLLAGLLATAMPYLAEEIHPDSLGLAMGIYIAGNAFGGMAGRIATSLLTDFYSWRVALGVEGLMGILCALWFWQSLPSSSNFIPQPHSMDGLWQKLLSHLKDPALLCLYGISFLLMGGFVTLYNYISYQLMEAPYHLSQALVGWIFLVYIFGSLGSTWLGNLADRFKRYRVLCATIVVMLAGILLTLNSNLPIKIGAIAISTFGFFGGHSIASSWVGKRARSDKAQASALYLFFYYAGSSIGGSLGGLFWSHFGWGGIVFMVGSFLVLAIGLALRLALLPPVSGQAVDNHSSIGEASQEIVLINQRLK
jgi:YNFM family putative membrane transporter